MYLNMLTFNEIYIDNAKLSISSGTIHLLHKVLKKRNKLNELIHIVKNNLQVCLISSILERFSGKEVSLESL